MPENNRLLWMWLLPVLLVSVWLTVPHLASDALWHDELMTYYQTGTGNFEPVSVVTLISRTAKDFSWPLGYYFLIAVWDWVSNGSLFIDRLLQLFTGLLAIAMLYQLGKTLFSARVGLIAALLLGVNALFIFYMHELRGHMLYLLTTIMCLWSYLLLLRDNHLRYRWRQLFFLVSTICALNVHYVATSAVMALGLYHLLFERQRPNWNRITFLGTLSFGIYGPWMGVMILEVVRRATVFVPVVHTIMALNVWFYVFLNGALWVLMLPLIVFSLRWWRQRAVQFVWFWLLVVVLINIVTNIWTDFLFHPRHLLILLIPICLLLALVLERLWHWFPAVALGAGLVWVVAGGFYSFTTGFMDIVPTQIPTIPLATIEDIQAVSEACVAKDETVIFALVDGESNEYIYQVPFFYYFDDYDYRFGNLMQMHDIREGEGADYTDVNYDARLDLMTARQAGVWLFTNPALPLYAAQQQFEAGLQARGFMTCPPVIDRPGLLGLYYARDGSSQCERVVACAGG